MHITVPGLTKTMLLGLQSLIFFDYTHAHALYFNGVVGVPNTSLMLIGTLLTYLLESFAN